MSRPLPPDESGATAITQYRRAYELTGQIGRVIIGDPWYEQGDD